MHKTERDGAFGVIQNKKSGVLGTYLSQVWNVSGCFETTLRPKYKDFEERSDRNYAFTNISVELIRYFGAPTFLGSKKWPLLPFTNLFTLHMTAIADKNINDYQAAAYYLTEVKQAMVRSLQFVRSNNASYVVAASNERLISALMHLVPGFEVVDSLPDGKMKTNIVEEAFEHKTRLGVEISRMTFPVVAMPKNNFVDVVSQRLVV